MKIVEFDNKNGYYSLNTPELRSHLRSELYHLEGDNSLPFIIFNSSDYATYSNIQGVSKLDELVFKLGKFLSNGKKTTPPEFVVTDEIMSRRMGAPLTQGTIKKMVPNYTDYIKVEETFGSDKFVGELLIEEMFSPLDYYETKSRIIKQVNSYMETLLKDVSDTELLYIDKNNGYDYSDVNFFTVKRHIGKESESSVIKRITDTIKQHLESKKKYREIDKMLENPEILNYIKSLKL